MNKFVMSKFASKEDLYKAKAEYYEKLFLAALKVLDDDYNAQQGEDDGEWYWAFSGEKIEDTETN